jgi:hypothetical protein
MTREPVHNPSLEETDHNAPLDWLAAMKESTRVALNAPSESNDEHYAVLRLTLQIEEIKGEENRLNFWRGLVGQTPEDRVLARVATDHYFKNLNKLPPARARELAFRDAERLDLSTQFGQDLHKHLAQSAGPNPPMSQALATRLAQTRKTLPLQR